MKQGLLTYEPVDPNVDAKAVTRLAGQNLRVLERLQQGPATNVELLEFSIRYSARVFDLRSKGFQIETKHDPETGLTIYTLLK